VKRHIFVGPVERLVYLRTVPLLHRLTSEELAILAEHAHEHYFRPGARLVQRGEPVELVHIIVEGRVGVSRGLEPIRMLSSRDSIGLLSLLASRHAPTRQRVEATATTRGMSLALEADAIFDLFEDRFSLFHNVLVAVCRLMRSERDKLRRSRRSSPPAADSLPARPDLVDRMLILGDALAFADGSSVALSQLARRVETIDLTPGETLWDRGDPATGLVVPLRGTLRCVGRRDARFAIPSGVVCGFIDSMADSTRSYGATAVDAVRALSISDDAILDVLEDHGEAALACMAVLAEDLLGVLSSRAANTDQIPEGMGWETSGRIDTWS
jgi:CRP-like cAMP-binding protein